GGFIKHALYGEVARKHAPSCCILGACFMLVCGKEGCIKHALYGEVARKHAPSCDTLSGIHVSYVGCSNPMDHRDMSQRYGNQFSRSQGHSQSPLPASSYSNEQPRRRGNQEAEIPLGILDSSQQGLSRKRSHDSISWDGNQGCFYCGEVGHIARHCMAEKVALAEEHSPLALLEDRPPRKRRNRI
ncbi:hypothetical protein HID58_093732, partial [Brassica napus]